MLHLIALVFAIPFLYVLYVAVLSYYNAWQYNRKAAARACKPAALRPYKYPAGIDMIMRVMDADKRHQIPNEFERLFFDELAGKSTLRMYLFGTLM